MLSIDEKIIDDRIPFIKFNCDLDICKGGCCTLKGGRGAPLEDFEIEEIENAIPVIKKHLTERSLTEIGVNKGIEGFPGNYTTGCIDNKDCVFVYYEEDIAKCAFEKSYFNNEISWRKPISCHLFPIRINDFGGDVLKYEKIIECKPALVKGKNDNIQLHDFLHEALVRKYGFEWYEKFRKICLTRLTVESEFEV